nr:MobQ family relaxase [Delftia sp.]
MAIFHFSAQVISRADGANAIQAAAYRAGLRMTCARTGQVFNYTRKKEVSHRAILAPEGAAPWALCRETLWAQAEQQKRKNAQLAREIEVALPIELTHAQQVALIHSYVQAQFISLGMVGDINIHSKRGNPHVHVLLTLSDIEADGFGAKRRDWNHPSLVARWREAWAKACNTAWKKPATQRALTTAATRSVALTCQPQCMKAAEHTPMPRRGMPAPSSTRGYAPK